MKCPHCGTDIGKAAWQGGILLRNRYLRVTAKGEMLIACPVCASELETRPGAKLVLFRTKVQRDPKTDALADA